MTGSSFSSSAAKFTKITVMQLTFVIITLLSVVNALFEDDLIKVRQQITSVTTHKFKQVCSNIFVFGSIQKGLDNLQPELLRQSFLTVIFAGIGYFAIHRIP